MSKESLLEKIRRHRSIEGKVSKYAEMSLTDEDAALRTAVIARRIQRLNVAYAVFCIVCFVLTLAFVGRDVWNSDVPYQATSVFRSYAIKALVTCSLTFLFSLCWLAVSFILLNIVRDYWADSDEKRLLEPLVGTYQCEEALKCLETGGPMVTEWRDLALTERNQLHNYDFWVMGALRDIFKEEQEIAADRTRRDAACKKIHGLGPAAHAAAMGKRTA